MTLGESTSIELNGLHYHLKNWGHGEQGEPLLLLHGFSGAASSWTTLAQGLADHYAIIAPDLLGHGQTATPADASRYRIENAARDLIAYLDARAIPSVNLLGYSMGGRLALFMALTYPTRIKTLILESASPGLQNPDARAARVRADESLAIQIEQNGSAWFVPYWEALPLFATQSEAIRAALRPVRLGHQTLGLANSLRGMGTGAQPSLWERLPELTCPVLLISGALDPKFAGIANQMAVTIPRVTIWNVPEAGHTVHLERPIEYVAFVRHWLANHAT